MYSYEQLGMHEEVKKKFEIICELTGSRKQMPSLVLWTDKALAEQQVELWQRISTRYS
jgi:hypothetical protein